MPSITPLLAADPARVGRYRLTGRVSGHPAADGRGEGKQAGRAGPDTAAFVVYLGRAAGGGPVTVTLLQPVGPADTAERDRFMAEARAARQVAPFCVARMVDAGFHGDFPYLISEHVAGPTLTEVVEAEGPPAEDVLLAIAIGAATGLAAIHQAGLVHGHFGPGELVLGRDGPRVVHSGVTPPYGRATPAADVLSWAHAVLFAATGISSLALAEPGPHELRLLEPSLRQLVTECAGHDPAARPPAKVIVTRLLGHDQPPAGILAAGSRAAGPARTAVRSVAAGDPPVPRQARRPAGRTIVAAAVAVIAAVAAVTAVVTLAHRGTAHGVVSGLRQSPAIAAGTPTAPPPPPSQVAGEPIPNSLSGTWAGQVRQENPPLAFGAQIQFSAGERAGAVSYPLFGCSGVLTLTRQNDTSFVFTQGIVSGQQTCGQGTVTLTRNGSALSFAFAPATPGGPGIQGTLSRQ